MRRNIVITALIATTLALAGAAARAASITATVAAIDSATRAITLKSAQGKVLVVTATPEVKNLAEVKVGDYLEVEYVEASALGLKPGKSPSWPSSSVSMRRRRRSRCARPSARWI